MGVAELVGTESELQARLRHIVPNIAARALETEQKKRLPDETFAELRDAGLLRINQPGQFGGRGVSGDAFGPGGALRQVAHELAKGCGSTAWVTAVLAGSSGILAALFPTEIQEEVWNDDPEALLCNVLFPAGTAVRADGGYVLNGRFPYASGSDFATWALLGTRIEGTEMAEGAICWGMLVPTADLSVIDDWDVLGLIATGSKSLVAEDVFVPDDRVKAVPHPAGTPGPYVFSSVASGIAAGALTRFTDYLAARGAIGPGWSAQSDAMRELVAESACEADAAWALITRDCAETEALLRTGAGLGDEVRGRNRRNAAYAMKLAVSATRRLFATSSGSAAHRTNLVQQSFRDVHTAALHFSLHWDVAAINAGKVLLSAPDDPGS
jgi:alkylation response protein AidB-like acyl-CoA dehydrogenase